MRYFDLRAFLRNLRFFIVAIIIMVILCAVAVAKILERRAERAWRVEQARVAERMR